MGQCDDPVVLSGEVMDQERNASNGHPFLVGGVCLARLWLAVYLGEHEIAGTWRRMQEARPKPVSGAPFSGGRHCFEGLAAFSMAKKTNERKWVKRALAVSRQASTWERRGNSNCRHIVFIFDAEESCLKGNCIAVVRTCISYCHKKWVPERQVASQWTSQRILRREGRRRRNEVLGQAPSGKRAGVIHGMRSMGGKLGSSARSMRI